jgi:LPXTG-motif cell wall-anchored protein
VGIAELQGYILALVGLGVLFLALTVLMFKKKLA